MKAAISASSCFTSGPMMNCWLSRTLSTAARMSCFMVAYSAFRSRKGKSIRADCNGIGLSGAGTLADEGLG